MFKEYHPHRSYLIHTDFLSLLFLLESQSPHELILPLGNTNTIYILSFTLFDPRCIHIRIYKATSYGNQRREGGREISTC